MLKLKYLFENYGLAKTALAHWPHDTEGLDELLTEFRISSNAIYPFRNGGNVCLLRLAPVEEKLKENIEGELEFLDYLQKNGYPAMRAVPSKEGEYLLTLKTGWGEYYASVFARVPGVRLDRTDFSDDKMLEYGAAMGKLHTLSAAYKAERPKWSHRDVLAWIGGVLAQYGADESAVTELARVSEALEALPKDGGCYGLVHYDFEPDNIFYNEADGGCYAIDFDDGMYCWYAVDVVQALDAIADELDGEEDRIKQACECFMRGYAANYPYTEQTAAMLPLMRRFRDLYSYARLIRSMDERFDNEPDWLIELREKLEHMKRKLEEGMK